MASKLKAATNVPQDRYLATCRERLWNKRTAWKLNDRNLFDSEETYADAESRLYFRGLLEAPVSDEGAVAKLHEFITFTEGDRNLLNTARKVAKAIKAGAWGAPDIAALRALLPIVRPLDNYYPECPTYMELMLEQVITYLVRPKVIAGGGGNGGTLPAAPAKVAPRFSVVGKAA
jgi:hypothetical protein